MKYAVIRIKNNQYKVEEGKTLLVDKLAKGEKVEPEVLLLVDGDKVKVGKPVVKGASLKFKVVEDEVKGGKLHIQTYKAKSRSRRKVGFRPVYTKLQVDKIVAK